jgi:hypothetical protein
MRPTLSKELAAVLFEMSNQIGSLQRVTVKGSRITSVPFNSSSASARFASRTRANAGGRLTVSAKVCLGGPFKELRRHGVHVDVKHRRWF